MPPFVQGVAGGIIVAPEGINGSICGTRAGIESVLAFLRSDPRFATMRNTEGPGPSEAPPSPSAMILSKAADKVKGNGWVGPKGEEWKATPFQRDRVNVKLKKEVRGHGSNQSTRRGAFLLSGCQNTEVAF